MPLTARSHAAPAIRIGAAGKLALQPAAASRTRGCCSRLAPDRRVRATQEV